jgi:RNA polymerase sigma factor (TIGR02999 family)
MTTRTTAAHLEAGFVECAYEDVRRIAGRQRRRFLHPDGPATTILAREAFRRIATRRLSSMELLRATARAMREVITDLARAKARFKRDSEGSDTADVGKLEIADALWIDGGEDRIVTLNDALQRLRSLNPRLGLVVDCRFFAGYSDRETAQAVGVDELTARRDWVKARAWLYREIGPDL